MSHRSTIYPCCLPTLGEFDRSWSHRTYPGTKVQKSSQLPNVLNLFCAGKYDEEFNILVNRRLFPDIFYGSCIKIGINVT